MLYDFGAFSKNIVNIFVFDSIGALRTINIESLSEGSFANQDDGRSWIMTNKNSGNLGNANGDQTWSSDFRSIAISSVAAICTLGLVIYPDRT